MTHKICYWDAEEKIQKERDATPEEALEIESRLAASSSPSVPASVTMRQARQRLAQAGLISTIDGIIDALEEPQKTQCRIEWEYSATVERDRPLVAMMMAAIPLSSEEVDTLFIEASQL